jgi:anti-sigma regulatory factor (Ser/Thr protein kinase)
MEIDQWEEEVERRLTLDENSEKNATLEIDKNSDMVEIIITDQGEGFDWEEFLEIDNERITDPHGRGIAIAKLFSFDDLNYEAPGNKVKVRIDLRPQ